MNKEAKENEMKSEWLPCETLFDEVDMGRSLSLSTRKSNLVAQASRSAHHDTHGPDLLFDFSVKDGANIRLSREHLDCRAGAVNLLGVAWSSDEEHDPEDLSSSVHGQDAGHPGPDPFKMFGRLDHPYES